MCLFYMFNLRFLFLLFSRYCYCFFMSFVFFFVLFVFLEMGSQTFWDLVLYFFVPCMLVEVVDNTVLIGSF